MADREWLRQTVDTANRPCPIIRKRCPGSRNQCAFWLEQVLTHEDGKTAAQGGCGYMWLYAIQLEVRSESIRTQACLDKTATQLRDGAATISSAISEASRRAIREADG